ncbi:hypothetical protein [Streptacidiphilus carbonis]|uniref:hypothetical protein n=1 Tax=Streptacidiphilus carbonis TaxID=105422 RepID=UPI0005A8FF3A|nr:hypothetical protein [Streptacidiphilus carbonis]
MRRRSVLLLVSGALAVAGVLVPSLAIKQSHGDTRITSVVVNGGRPIVLGPSGDVAFGFSITAEDDSGIGSVDGVGLWGSDYGALRSSAVTCTAKSATVSVCTGTSSVDVTRQQIYDDMAGSWYVQATAHGRDGDRRTETKAGTFGILKAGRLSSFGAPRAAPRGATISISGLLERAQWKTQQWAPSPDQTVRLEFCAKGCTTPQTVATVDSDGQGQFTARVRAEHTGTYTWVYPGTAWAEPLSSYAVQVTVR